MCPEEGDFEEVYDDEGREDLVDNDSISAEEEAFMKGYDEEQERRLQEKEDEDDEEYDKAFSKKRRRSKRKSQTFDEEDILEDVEMR